jgi:hypothetical protein
MKILDVSNINASAQMPVKKGTLQFLQDAYKELANAILRGTIGGGYSASTYYILHGCANTGVGSNYIISAGAIFFNGEIYLVDGTTFTTTGGQVPVMNIATTQYTTDADPVTFTNNVQYNIHDIRKIVISAGTASGNQYGVNSTNVFVNYANSTPNIIEQGSFASLQTKVIQIGSWDIPGSGDTIAIPHGIPDFKKIRSIDVQIINDDEDNVICLWYSIGGIVGGQYSYDATDITIDVAPASIFSTTAYDNPAINRGYITIQYEA